MHEKEVRRTWVNLSFSVEELQKGGRESVALWVQEKAGEIGGGMSLEKEVYRSIVLHSKSCELEATDTESWFSACGSFLSFECGLGKEDGGIYMVAI